MTLSEAKKTAKELLGIDVPFSYRNVWVFFAPTDTGKRDLIITKEGAAVRYPGTFFGDPNSDILIDSATGAAVAPEDVFGKPFFADDPSLRIDTTTPADMDTAQKIDLLFQQIKNLLKKTNAPTAAMFLANDLMEDYDETAYQRLVVLYNYLSTYAKEISMEEFSYLHHELYTLE